MCHIGGCIFVVYDQPEGSATIAACDHPYCQSYKSLRRAYLSIEPVMNWNSLAMAEETGLFGCDTMVFKRTNGISSTSDNDSTSHLKFCVTCIESLWRGDGLLKAYSDNIGPSAIISSESQQMHNTQPNPVRTDNAVVVPGLSWVDVQSPVTPQKRSGVDSRDLREVVKRRLSVPTDPGNATHINAVELQEEGNKSLTEFETDNQSVDKRAPDSLSLDGSHDHTSGEAAAGGKPILPRKSVTRGMVRTAAIRVGSMITNPESASSETDRPGSSAVSRAYTPIDRFSVTTVHHSSRGSSRLSTPVVPSSAPSATLQPIVSRVSQLPHELLELWCTCQQEYHGELMIRCNNDYCKIAWYHSRCLSLRETDVLPDWLCPQCASDEKEAAEWWYIPKLFAKPPQEDPYGLATMTRAPVIDAYRWSRGPPPTLMSAGYGTPVQPEAFLESTHQERGQVEDPMDVVEENKFGARCGGRTGGHEEIGTDTTGYDGDLDNQHSDPSDAPAMGTTDSYKNNHQMRIFQSVPDSSTPQGNRSDRPSTPVRFTREQVEVLMNWLSQYADGPPTLDERRAAARELEGKIGLARDKIQAWMYRNIKSATIQGKWHQ